MVKYRITKYDPAYRGSDDVYLRNEWTARSDIGRSFNGWVLTEEEYQRVEDSYVKSAIAYMQEAGVLSLRAVEVTNHAQRALSLREGSRLKVTELGPAIRCMLREECWCRLEGTEAYVHFGYDYYMYVAVPRECPQARALAEHLGLFVERQGAQYLRGL